jgi:hypothetical protein
MTFNLGADSPFAQVLYVRKMQQRGFLVASYHYVMLAHDEDKVQQLLRAADETMGEIVELITNGTLAKEAGVQIGQRGFARLA